MATVSSSFTELAIDCADPGALAAFWCAVLGYEVRGTGADAGLVTIGSTTDPRAVTLAFAQVPEAKTVKNRLHLDLNPGDRSQEQEVERLVALGAGRVDVGQGPDDDWVVMADPEGNEFCVLAAQLPAVGDA